MDPIELNHDITRAKYEVVDGFGSTVIDTSPWMGTTVVQGALFKSTLPWLSYRLLASPARVRHYNRLT
jgi:hypothetical protein